MSLRILIATHAPADRRTAVYRSVSDRASHLRSVGCTVDVLTRDDLARPAWARLDPLVLPILLAARDLSMYDVIVFHSYLGWVFHSLRRWFDPGRRTRTITWFHGLEPLYHRATRDEHRRQGRELSWRFRLLHEIVMPRLLKRSCRASDAVFCFNSIEAGYLASEGWAEPHRVQQVSNGVEPECFLPRRHHGVARRLLFVGQWLPAKGIRYLVDAFTSLAALGDVELACVGTGTSADDVLAAFPAAVRSRVSVFAHVDRHELYEQLARADVFVFPSLSEGFSCALLEAMAASMPVVATRVGAAVDLLDDGRNGVLVPSADASAIVAAVTRMVGDLRTRTVMGEAARRTASGFTSEAAGAGFAIKVLDVVMRRGHVERRRAVMGAMLSAEGRSREANDRALRVLFFVEGFTDIRFVVGLSEICDLTMAVPEHAYVESTLKERVARSGAHLTVREIPGGRLAFQARSFAYLWKTAGDFDVILSQEVLRGSLNATTVGALRGVPVVTFMALSPVEYFRCRRERGQIGAGAAWAGECAIRSLMSINGRLATRCLALGPYLEGVASQVCPRTEMGYYYGVDVDLFRPAGEEERQRLRARLNLPADKFLIVLASRISHEKDPETVLHAVALARAHGLDAALLNLGGGYQEFLTLAGSLGIADAHSWVLGRPAVHPMQELADYFRAADVLVQGSLAEGFGLSPLEALACETPVVATAVGGMAAHLGPYAALTPRRDAEAMARAILEVDADPTMTRIRARHGREYVRGYWSRERAFRELKRTLFAVANRRDRSNTREAA